MKALRGVDYTKYALSLFIRSSPQKMSKFKALSYCQKLFCQHQTSSCICSVNRHVTCMQNIEGIR